MAEIMSAADLIVLKHKAGEMSFHVAYDFLIDEFNIEPEVAFNMLHPPIGEDDWNIQVE